MNDIFDQIGEAQASFGNPWLNPGKYLLEVQKLLLKPDRNGIMQFIAEFKVLESMKTDPTIEPNAVGTSASFVVKLNKDPAKGNIKNFFMAFQGMTEAQYDAKVEDPEHKGEKIAAGPLESRKLIRDNTGRFFRIRDEAYIKPLKDGSPFTRHTWSHVEASLTEVKDIVERQKKAA